MHFSTHFARPGERTRTASLIQELKGSSGQAVISAEKFVELLETVRYHSRSKDLVLSYGRRLTDMAAILSTEETIKIVSGLAKLPLATQLDETREILRRVTVNLVKHGVSSFSLESFMEYAKLCRMLRVSADAMLIKSFCLRVVAVNPSNESDQLEYVKYLLNLDRVLVNTILLERIKDVTSVNKMNSFATDIRIINDLELLCDAHGLTEDDKLRIVCLNSLNTALSNADLVDLLTQASDLHSSSPILERLLLAIQPQIESVMNDPSQSALLLNIVSKKRPLPDYLIGSNLNILCLKALDDTPRALTTLRAITRIFNNTTENISKDLYTRLVESFLQQSDLPLEDTENFVKFVECATVLNIVHPGFTGIVARRINKMHSAGTLTNSFWKLASWWQLTVHRLPFDSIIPDIITREFPQTIAALKECEVESLVQPVSAKIQTLLNDTLIEKLTALNAPYTPFPRIGHTPVRAHARVQLADASVCYVFLTKGDSLLQISASTYVSRRMLQECIKIAGAKLSFFPIDSIKSVKPPELFRLIEQNVA